jgi:hypothetical protein
MQLELAENWFRTATFQLGHNFHETSNFITGKDTLGFGFSIGSLVSKVNFRIFQQHLYETWKERWCYYDGDNDKFKMIHSSPRAKLLHGMENLFSFRKGVHITITIQAMFELNHGWYGTSPEEYFAVIFPLLNRLRETGHKVSVFVADERDWLIDYVGWELNFNNAGFSLQGWMEKLEEVSVMSTASFLDTNYQ